jgi:hypothetical protein
LDEEILNILWEEKCHGIKTTIECILLYEWRHDYEVIVRMIIMMNFTTIGLNITLRSHAQIKNYKQYQDHTTMLQSVSPKDNFSCEKHENAK